jgi:ornithine carbamoyltransferase
MSTRHFLTLKDLTSDELKQLIIRAGELKQMRNAGQLYEPLQNHVMAMIFEKASTRRHATGPWRTGGGQCQGYLEHGRCCHDPDVQP